MAKNIKKATTGNHWSPEYLNHVTASFDGLRDSVEKLPDGKDKIEIMFQVGNTYIAATKVFCSLAGGVPLSPATT